MNTYYYINVFTQVCTFSTEISEPELESESDDSELESEVGESPGIKKITIQLQLQKKCYKKFSQSFFLPLYI